MYDKNNKRGYGSRGGSHPNEPAKSLVEGEVDKILNLNDDSVEVFVKNAEECAENFNLISSSKIRNFYDYVKQIETKGYDKVNLHLLKPKIAYAVGRADKDKDALQLFQKTMDDLIDKTTDEKQFKNFVRFFEAIIAYHKIQGGK